MGENSMKNKFTNLLKRLGLENYYPNKMGTADFHLIRKTTYQHCPPPTENELPSYYLQNLLMLDCRVRYLICKDHSEAKQSVTAVLNTPEGGSETSNVDDFLSDITEENAECAPYCACVHPMDIQMAIFHCADDFTRQYLSTKLAICQFALPLLVPDPCSSQIEFPLWSLSQVKKSWGRAENSGVEATIKNYEKLIYQADTPFVSFMRLGSSSSSKSQIMNALLSQHDIFFHRHCRSSSKDCLLMNGVVEISWYCPGGRDDDRFDNCIAFTNLHGDATEHEKQVKFLQEITSLNVVLCSASGMNEKNKQVLQGLLESPKPLVCLFTDKENIVAGKSNLNIKLGLKNRNESELIDELAGAIKGLLTGSCPTCSLEGSVAIAQQHGFIIDEDKVECKEAKSKAQVLTALLKEKKLPEMKAELLPLQGELWHRWCKKDKELGRLEEKRNRSIEEHQSQIESEKHAIRSEQFDKAFPPNPFMQLVLEIFQSRPETTKKYSLQWLKIYMDDLSFIGLDNILREVGQMYEAQNEIEKMNLKNILDLPQIAADLMISGYPVELMDGDASYVPLKWVSAIFDKLMKKLGDKKVFVLSVLGIQSSGKSTLLNAMFGLQFSVSAGRCTKGAFMQLIKVGENLQQDLNFDYLLVVDTEGLRATELTNELPFTHDNELATFVIGIGNMTLINIFGENPSEMQDILQIAVQAFLRMKQVRLSPSCLFVHQNVSEITAKEKNMEGRKHLQEKLDEMTVLAAQHESHDVTSFSDVILFDVNTHIHYFTNLWKGDPPMAPPNPSYSQNVQELKRKIFLAAEKEPKGRILKMSELKVRFSDLWKALVNENFIFSFKNTLEIVIYNRLETMYSQWTWQLRSHFLELQEKLTNRIRNSELMQPTRGSLEEEVKEKYDAIIKDFERYFDEATHKEILIQWKENIHNKLKSLKESLVCETCRKCEELTRLQESQKNVDQMKSVYEREILERSKHLASSLEVKELSENIDLREHDLREHFNSLWTTWVSDLSKKIPPTEDPNISSDAEDIFLERFRQESNIGEKVKGFSGRSTFKINISKHMKRNIPKKLKPLSDCDKQNIERITERITQRVIEYIDERESQRLGYDPSYFPGILNIIFKKTDSTQTVGGSNYTFTNEYKMDLSLHLFQVAAGKFEEMYKAFKEANDPVRYFESKREDFFKSFQISFQGSASIKIFADLLCNKLCAAVHPAVHAKAAVAIADEMRSNYPAFNSNRSNLEFHILKSLAEEEDFEKYKQYISFPKDFFKGFIEKRVSDYCLDTNNPRVNDFLHQSIEHYKTLVQSAMDKSCKDVEVKEATSWLDVFCSHLKDDVNFPRSELTSVEHLALSDMEFFKEATKEAWATVTEILKMDTCCGHMNNFQMKPHKILFKQLCGCWEQCPFCKAICTHTVPGHDGDHSVHFHRPEAVAGWFWKWDKHLVIDICSSLVASDCIFIPGDDKKIRFPYKQYRTAGPPYNSWRITPHTSAQSYWKWFVCKFRSELENLHGKTFEGKGSIPKAWESLTKETVLSELNLSCNISLEKV